jgi:acyl-CoA reductase-like NAD-dependent aldehyde dehydrogenase
MVSLKMIAKTVLQLREHFNSGLTRSLTYRQQQLVGLKSFIKQNEQKISLALYKDLGKPLAEVLAAEIALVMKELQFTQKRLRRWVKPQRVATGLFAQPGKSAIYPEPLGIILIIAPWNYPIQLTLVPLLGAIAAGNCVIIKPSEMAPATSHLLANELPKYIDHRCLAIIEGGSAETTALLNEHVDHLFYTGGAVVGKLVMMAAAKTLTPVTLELGGKSPCIVDQHTNLNVAARRIVWGKFSNAGQSCVAPDYVLAHESIEVKLVTAIQEALLNFYGKNPQTSPDYGRIINHHHFQRLMHLLPGSGDIYLGGDSDEGDRYIAPTILRHVSPNAPIMAEEIFGPILPVLTIKNIDEAIDFINARPKPLALYLFSSDVKIQKRIIYHTSSGSVSVNYPMLQLTVPSLPFGGVGMSGMGAYHGKMSFDIFSHHKAVLIKPTWFDFSMMYPPYTIKFMRLLRWLINI